MLLTSKIGNFFTKCSDQRERAILGGTVAPIWLAALPPYASFFLFGSSRQAVPKNSAWTVLRREQLLRQSHRIRRPCAKSVLLRWPSRRSS